MAAINGVIESCCRYHCENEGCSYEDKRKSNIGAIPCPRCGNRIEPDWIRVLSLEIPQSILYQEPDDEARH